MIADVRALSVEDLVAGALADGGREPRGEVYQEFNDERRGIELDLLVVPLDARACNDLTTCPLDACTDASGSRELIFEDAVDRMFGPVVAAARDAAFFHAVSGGRRQRIATPRPAAGVPAGHRVTCHFPDTMAATCLAFDSQAGRSMRVPPAAHTNPKETTMSTPVQQRRITTRHFRKGHGPYVCLTAYTAPMARLLDPHVDLLLVGDFLGMVVYGMETTVPVTLDMMIAHGAAVVRSTQHACIVVDLPFGSYQESPQQAFRNAARLLAETGATAVKLEGGVAMAETIRFLTQRGIPVCGHIGLMPQAVNASGFRAQGRTAEEAAIITADATAVADAGAFAMVIEGTYRTLATTITQSVAIPTIGIGASPDCDGQILVTDDLLGLFGTFTPRFVKRYAEPRQRRLRSRGRLRARRAGRDFSGTRALLRSVSGDSTALPRKSVWSGSDQSGRGRPQAQAPGGKPCAGHLYRRRCGIVGRHKAGHDCLIVTQQNNALIISRTPRGPCHTASSMPRTFISIRRCARWRCAIRNLPNSSATRPGAPSSASSICA